LCPECNYVISQKKSIRIYETKDAFSEDDLALFEYDLQNGDIVREFLQAQPWSSGPMSFLCLEINGKKIFEWKDEEIDNLL
jgi:hypothetical protein